VVVGAGNAGVDVARTAIRQGATHVTAIDQQQGIPALQDEAREATAEGVTFRMGLNPVRLSATSGLVCETSEGDDTIEIAADLVIFSVGQTVVSDGLEELDLHWSDNGTLLIDAETGQTSHPLIFAAGDMAPTPRTVTDAMGSGRRAAFGVDAALRGKNTAAAMTPPPAGRPWPETHPAPVAVHRSDSSRMRAAAPHLAPPKRGLEDEVVGALDESSARAEARRCMLCGSCASCHTCIDTFGCPAFIAVGTKVEIDPTLCVGCGDCATFCPNGAIQEEMGGVG
jgi:ferredoxin